MDEHVVCWPGWMPRPAKNNYSYELSDRTVESQMDIGAIRRVEFDTDETIISCNLVLCNRLQLEWFEKFHRDCLRHGTKWFKMPIYMSGHVDWYLVQIQGQPKFGGLIGITHTTVTLKLRIEKRDLLDDDIFEVITLFGVQFILDLAALSREENLFGVLGGVSNLHADTWEWWREFDEGIAFAVPRFAGVTNGPEEIWAQ